MSIAIFLLALALILYRPGGLGIGYSALGGAILVWAVGAVPAIPALRAILGNITTALVIWLTLSWVLEKIGAFRWLAVRVARHPWGSGWRVFLLVGTITALTGPFLTNWGSILVVTPITLEILVLLGFDPKATLALAAVAGFTADVSSLALSGSNLVNTLVASYLDISPGRYALVILPVTVLASLTHLAVLLFYFWPDIPATGQPFPRVKSTLQEASGPVKAPSRPDPAPKSPPSKAPETAENSTFFVDPVSGFSYSVSSVPLHLSAFGPAFRRVLTPLGTVLKTIPTQILLFSWGMPILVLSLNSAGLLNALAFAATQLERWGLPLAILGTGLSASVLAALTHNLPVALTYATVLQSSSLEAGVREGMIYATVIGCTLGAKLTPFGSVSTLLWLDLLERRGIDLGWRAYCRIAAIVTLPVLFSALLSLSVWLLWLLPD